MMFMILGVGLFLLPILFRLALKLRLGIPILYAVLMLTAFHGWYQAHTALADGIFFALVGLAALSWVVTLLRRLWDMLEDWREERAMADLLAYRVRQARAAGEYAIDTEGLFYPSPINSRISRSLILIQPTSTSILNKISPP